MKDSEKPRRIYVKVKSIFDETGYMRPVSLIWGSRVLPIEDIRDFRSASSQAGANLPGDCYTVVIHGEEKHLFFEKTGPLFPARVGRWFVESSR